MGAGGAGRETSIDDGEKDEPAAEFLANDGDFNPLLALRFEPVEDLASPFVVTLVFFLLKRPILQVQDLSEARGKLSPLSLIRRKVRKTVYSAASWVDETVGKR